VLWQPYEVYPDDLTEVAASARADGIDLYLSGQSLYDPGQTLAVFFSPAG
jgi:hypothetical protein